MSEVASAAAADAPPVDAQRFRTLIARWATGVSVVTARDGTTDFGLTVNALLSVALEPPELLVSLQKDADTTPIVRRTRMFAVSLLAFDQRAVSERFARMIPPEEKFRDLPLHRGVTGLAMLPETIAEFECRVVDETRSADHFLFVGEVVGARVGREVPPLVFYRSRYAELDPPDRLRLAASSP